MIPPVISDIPWAGIVRAPKLFGPATLNLTYHKGKKIYLQWGVILTQVGDSLSIDPKMIKNLRSANMGGRLLA
jgi:hypothetical protein